jgi:dihydroxyacetone kinase-like protein
MALMPAAESVAHMAEAIIDDLPFRAGDRVVAMLNGMGGTPLVELYLVYGELEQYLRSRKITVARRLVGNYITSLDMSGFSITLLQADDELLSLWDDPVLTPALRWGI